MSDPDLELVQTRKLVLELFRRFDNAAFVGMRVGEDGENTMAICRMWHGEPHAVAGLCMHAANWTIQKFNESSSTEPPYEEPPEEDAD